MSADPSRRSFVLGSMTAQAAPAQPAGAGRPNVLFIMVDQQHPRCLGFTGHPVVRTPRLDELAKSGVVFDRAYCANPLCMPSRASVFTGLTTRGHRARMNGISLDRQILTFPEILRRSGYRTHAVGKLHFGTAVAPKGISPGSVDPARFPEVGALWKSGRIRDLPLPYYGFESVDYVNGHGHGSFGHYVQWLEREHPREARLFHEAVPLSAPSPAYKLYNRQSYKWALPEELHPMTWITDRTVDFLRSARSGGRPFFLFCSIQDPHQPFAPPAPWCYRHRPADAPPAVRRAGELDHLPPHFRQQYETALVTQGSFGQPMKATDPYRDECAAHYYGLIEMMDERIGRVLDALRESGLDRNTVVIFTADHGEALGDHWMWGKGPYHFDSVIRVPLVVRWPGRAAAGMREPRVVSLLDLAPTILDAAGVSHPDDLPSSRIEAPQAPPAWPGRSLRSMVEAPGKGGADVAAVVEEDEDYLGLRMRTLVTARYRLTAYSGQPYGELFDLESDPDEFRNLWSDPSARPLRDDLRVTLLDRLMQTDLPLPRQTARS